MVHLVGDQYVSEAASRMKHQLRASDMLGRLGGDEFGVILPIVHNRAEIEEVGIPNSLPSIIPVLL